MKERRNGKKSKWVKTGVPNLYRKSDSGKFYFRASISTHGKRRDVWKCLKTDVLTVAKLRLHDHQADMEHKRQTLSALDSKDVTIAQLGALYAERVTADADLEPKSKEARREALARLWRTWPDLKATKVQDLTEKDCQRWLNAFKTDAAGLARPRKEKVPGATTVNTTIDCLRRLMAIAVENGFIYRNPAENLTRKPPPRKHLRLPSGQQFRQLVAEIAKNKKAPGSADTVALLGFSGLRLSEGMALRWRDVDFDRGLLHVSGTKTDGAFRTIPLFPPLRHLLERMQAEKSPKASDAVLTARDCQRSIDKAAEALEMPRMTHHDLRHFFISSCIETGIDFLTISRWVGHSDGGVLISRVYGHLRREYSMEAAQRMTFGEIQSTAGED
jgi:integrase